MLLTAPPIDSGRLKMPNSEGLSVFEFQVETARTVGRPSLGIR